MVPPPDSVAPPPPPPPPPPGVPPSPWMPPPAPAAPPKRKMLGMSRNLLIVVVVVVILVVLLAGLFAAGVLTVSSSSSGSSSSGSGSGENYTAAEAAAAPSTSSVAGGPWLPAGGIAVQLTSSVSINSTLLNKTFDFGCGGHVLSGASSLTSFPATTSSPSSGDSALWVIVFSNASGGALEVAVINGAATPVFTLTSFQSCAIGGSTLALPSQVVNSPVVAAAAWSKGGSSYAANHTSFDTDYILVPIEQGTTTYSYTYWVVSYTNCNPNEQGTTLDGKAPAQLTVLYNATSGAFITSEPSATACPVLSGSGGSGKPALSSVCYPAFVEENDTPVVPETFWNNGTLACTVKSLTGADLTVGIVNTTMDTPVTTTGFTLAVVNYSSMATVATYSFSTNTWSTPGAEVAGEYAEVEWILTTSTSMAGNSIVITATSSAPVTGSVTGSLGEG